MSNVITTCTNRCWPALQVMVLVLLCCCGAIAQPSVKTFVDKPGILIGEQFKLRVEASFDPAQYKLRWLAVPDSMAHFEVVERGPLDSLRSDGRIVGVSQSFTLTSFDSGRWLLPSFVVGIDPVNSPPANFFTDSVPVTVSFSVSDTSNVLRDIKPIRKVSAINPLWYWAIGAGILLLALFLLWWMRRKRVPAAETSSPRNRLSAYEQAQQQLKELYRIEPIGADATRQVHSKAAAILKQFMSVNEGEPFEQQTTGEILLYLKRQEHKPELVAATAAALGSGDAVKFAKFLPDKSETFHALDSISALIETLHKRLHSSTESKLG